MRDSEREFDAYVKFRRRGGVARDTKWTKHNEPRLGDERRPKGTFRKAIDAWLRRPKS